MGHIEAIRLLDGEKVKPYVAGHYAFGRNQIRPLKPCGLIHSAAL